MYLEQKKNIIQKIFGLGAADGSGHYAISSQVIQTWKNEIIPSNIQSINSNNANVISMINEIWKGVAQDWANIALANIGAGLTTFCFLSETPNETYYSLINSCKDIFNISYTVSNLGDNIFSVQLGICKYPAKGKIFVNGIYDRTINKAEFRNQYVNTTYYNVPDIHADFNSETCLADCGNTGNSNPSDNTNTQPVKSDCPCDCKETSSIKTVYLSKTPAGNNPIPFKISVKKQICTTTPQPPTYQFICADELQKIKDGINATTGMIVTEIPTGDEAGPMPITPIQQPDLSFPNAIGVQGGVSGFNKKSNGYK